MGRYATYLLVPIMSILLVSAQSLWGSAIKNDKPFDHPLKGIILAFIQNPKIWGGIFLYALATLVYFLLLSRHKFFAVQLGLAALAILFSTALSAFLFHEKLTPLNLIGMVTVIGGLGMVLSK
jgi:drug/metabolite transporter (DMT)-like permease